MDSNSRQFPLPTELILQIVSQLGNHRCRDGFYDKDAFPLYFERQAALRALSQTSQRLRGVCLPVLWDYLDVYCYPLKSDLTYLRPKLERLISGLIESPTLAAYVQYVVSPHVPSSWSVNTSLWCV
jgi:hypothetical protein